MLRGRDVRYSIRRAADALRRAFSTLIAFPTFAPALAACAERATMAPSGTIEPKTHRVICAWCRVVLTPGAEPASHGICPRCAGGLRKPKDFTQDPASGWKAALALLLLLVLAVPARAEESRGKLLLTYGLARGVPAALTEVALGDPRAREGNPLMGQRSVRIGVNTLAVLVLAEGTRAMSMTHPNRAKWFKRAVVLLCIADTANNVVALRRLR